MPFEEFDEQSDQREYQEEVNQPSECVRGNHTRRPNDENQDGEYHRHGCCPDGSMVECPISSWRQSAADLRVILVDLSAREGRRGVAP